MMSTLKKPNRDKQTQPKLGKFWCYNCDMHKVGEGQVCPMCGCKQLSKRRKKK